MRFGSPLLLAALLLMPPFAAIAQEKAVPSQSQPSAQTQSPAQAQSPASAASGSARQEKPAPYDERLERLSEIVGAVHYLRNLCKSQSEPAWRLSFEALMEMETKGEPQRRARLTAAFNRGYRSFASVYTACTAAAVRAEQNYRNEGATLATEITARYGN